jgi:2-keto-4-pentenoate hydratase
LVLGDAGELVTLANAGAITLTVPTFASAAFAVGQRVDMVQLGAGQVTVVGAGGVTVSATPGLKARAQYSAMSLVNIAADTWLLVGDLDV